MLPPFPILSLLMTGTQNHWVEASVWSETHHPSPPASTSPGTPQFLWLCSPDTAYGKGPNCPPLREWSLQLKTPHESLVPVTNATLDTRCHQQLKSTAAGLGKLWLSVLHSHRRLCVCPSHLRSSWRQQWSWQQFNLGWDAPPNTSLIPTAAEISKRSKAFHEITVSEQMPRCTGGFVGV